MTWVRLDDQVAHHPKLRRAGPEAAWLWVCGLSHCNRFTTNGQIDRDDLAVLYPGAWGPKKLARLAAKLVEVELWREVDGGYEVHDYAHYQAEAMSDVVAERRRQARERQASRRRRLSGNAPDPDGKPPSAGGSSSEERTSDDRSATQSEPRKGANHPEGVARSQRDGPVTRARALSRPVPARPDPRDDDQPKPPPEVDPGIWRLAAVIEASPRLAAHTTDALRLAETWLRGWPLERGVEAALEAVEAAVADTPDTEGASRLLARCRTYVSNRRRDVTSGRYRRQEEPERPPPLPPPPSEPTARRPHPMDRLMAATPRPAPGRTYAEARAELVAKMGVA